MAKTNLPMLPPDVAPGLLSPFVFDIEEVRDRLETRGGGYEIAHASPGLELGVYVLVPSGLTSQLVQPHAQIYVVLGGRGIAGVEGSVMALERGEAVFVPGGARHVFVTYERLSLLVISAPRRGFESPAAVAHRSRID